MNEKKTGRWVQIYGPQRRIAARVLYCDTPVTRGIGMMGRKTLDEEGGILMRLPDYQQGRSGFVVSIHMLGVAFPLGVAWLDLHGRVVHTTLARPWRLYYSTPFPAWYTLELHPSRLAELQPGVILHWEEA